MPVDPLIIFGIIARSRFLEAERADSYKQMEGFLIEFVKGGTIK